MKRVSKAVVMAVALSFGLAACGGSQYILSTKEGRMLVSDGKPQLDEKSGMYKLRDADGKATMVNKDDIVQIMER
ncbi:YgdI/YgdR family lipoprotein [Niveibacterium sp. 24ML]|uniref:YgdI/YgdR family lipoprotein n=1 Tax=Niveibacterium sp. 24ML TaxID=2985512 RepID=UPI00227157C2|nr:YgdI/YgdR family lipoprotein [Niveibacterium sp. 24ML]MCX9154730.1 YgdI/YgdR family lipoprotein [Niveibacterium sp. 24ML]